jgi:hypothetical protein
MQNNSSKIRPLGNRVLIKLLSNDGQVGKIHVLNAYGDYSKGIVLELPPRYASLPHGAGRDIEMGATVMFNKNVIEVASVGENLFFVPIEAIEGLCQEKPSLAEDKMRDFFALPTWNDFTNNGEILKIIKEWQNIKRFNLRMRFLEPFRELLPLAQRMYEYCHQEIQPYVGNNFDAFGLDIQEDKRNQLQDQSIAVAKCDDDYWDGMLILSGKDRLFDFVKTKTDIKTIVETVPIWMLAYYRTIMDPLFQQVAGVDYSRVTLFSINVHQVIRLEERGGRNANIRNCYSMGQFLRFGLAQEESKISPTLSQFGIGDPLEESIGRVDLKFSYDRKIGRERPYKIWFTAEAPLNDKAKLLHVNWEIQDIYPKDILSQHYGIVMQEFFRDVVLKGVYNTWFENITCSTDR